MQRMPRCLGLRLKLPAASVAEDERDDLDGLAKAHLASDHAAGHTLSVWTALLARLRPRDRLLLVRV